MTTPIEGTKSAEIGGSTLTFESANNCAQVSRGRVAEKKVDVVGIATKLNNRTADAINNASKHLTNKRKVGKKLPAELRAKDDAHTKMVDTVTCCIKIKCPDFLRPVLDSLVPKARACVDRMLAHRDQSSSKYYHEIPSAISKSLIAKYQRNKKCKSVTNLVLPISGDKGRQIKLEAGGLRIPALFKKEILPVIWLRLPVGFIRSAEFFMRKGGWYAAVCYNAKADKQFVCTGTVGVDRNSVGAVATLADPQSGKVLHLGFNPAKTKEVWRGRKANLQGLGKKRLLHEIRNKQSRRTKYENHVVSKQIVDYAAKHRRCINVEKLENVRKGKIRRYSESSQWSFYQLLQFILYKAALRGVMVLEVDSAYTSQECSRCHQLTKPNGKSYRCGHCGHNDHRDANAAFNVAGRAMPIGGVVGDSVRSDSGLLVVPFLGTEVQQCN
ncbi:MAG TPA: transposase [Candidatus Paceibacterota bacterium]|jgi:IS605 OrfB family transposase|nr:transposase [Candidatus Paceibacterota bacterium]